MPAKPTCYACKKPRHTAHPQYPGLCSSCGDLNALKREARADLSGKTALVTGARVGIGHAVALRLLRDGARVQATTRFPADAARRYALEPDFEDWRARLTLHGLDFRNLPALESFALSLSDSLERLDLLINNAAQTVRPKPEAVAALQMRERDPLPEKLHALLGVGVISSSASHPLALETLTPVLPLAPLETGHSWDLRAPDVSLLEMVEVQVINAIAPFVLTGRLLGLLGRSSPAFVVNVSSVEGRFSGRDKPGRHPHTNMAKAALNMFTRTSSREFKALGVYMNSVDPGWVSFQQSESGQETLRARDLSPPFDLQDAAARVLDPVYVGLNEGKLEWGRFFKDYAPIDW